MEWLKKLLEKLQVDEELVNKIIEGSKDIKMIPKERFDEVNNQVKDLKTQIAERDTQLEDLSKKAKGNEELTTKIAELKDANKQAQEQYELKIRDIQLNSAISSKLKDGGARHVDLLVGKFDRDKLTIGEDGSISGLDEQFNSLKESYKDLFEQSLQGGKPFGGDPGNPGGGAKHFTKEMVDSMSHEDVFKNMGAIQESMKSW